MFKLIRTITTRFNNRDIVEVDDQVVGEYVLFREAQSAMINCAKRWFTTYRDLTTAPVRGAYLFRAGDRANVYCRKLAFEYPDRMVGVEFKVVGE